MTLTCRWCKAPAYECGDGTICHSEVPSIPEKECRARRIEECLRELHAIVKGECPSLLNEDSGGFGELDVQIEHLFSGHKGNA